MHFYIGHTMQFEFALITRCCLIFFDCAVHLTRRFNFYFYFYFGKKILNKKLKFYLLNKFVSHTICSIDIKNIFARYFLSANNLTITFPQFLSCMCPSKLRTNSYKVN